MRPRIQPASARHEADFLAAVRRSTALHRPWVTPPATPSEFRSYLATLDGVRKMGFFVFTEDDEIAGVANVGEIIRGRLQSAFLGYYAFAPHHGAGHMTHGLAAVITVAFRKHHLHRLEANIQPGNRSSIALARRLGFRKEGFAPRYLKIGGRWRDHERWAITTEEWKPPRPAGAARHG